jgi:putative membrane protein
MSRSSQTPAPGTRMEAVSAVVDRLGGALAQVLAASSITRPQFIQHAVVANLYVIEAARIAIERARRHDVAEFARAILTDHEKIRSELLSFIGGGNSPQMPPEEVDGLHRILLGDLHGAADDAFDARYAAQQQIAFGEALTLFKTYYRTGRDEGLRSLIAIATPLLEQHRDMADRLAEEIAA